RAAAATCWPPGCRDIWRTSARAELSARRRGSEAANLQPPALWRAGLQPVPDPPAARSPVPPLPQCRRVQQRMQPLRNTAEPIPPRIPVFVFFSPDNPQLIGPTKGELNAH